MAKARFGIDPSGLVRSGAVPVAALLGVWGLGLVLPDHNSSYVMYVVLMCGIAAVAAVGLNLVLGLTGQFSLGHAGFMAVGAYTGALFTKSWGGDDRYGLVFLLAILAGGAVAAAVGWLVGVPSLRLRGDYLAIVTLGFGEIIRSIVENSEPLGGAMGIVGIPQQTNFAWVFGWLVISVLFARRLLQSTHGRALLSVREDEIAAEAMGVDTTGYKVRAFVMSAFFGGVAGVLFAHLLTTINPRSFTFVRSIEIVTMVVLGGMGSTTGAVVAAFGLTALPEVLKTLQGNLAADAEFRGWSDGVINALGKDYKNVIYSLVLLGMMLVRPRGLLGQWEFWKLWEKSPERVLSDDAKGNALIVAEGATIRFGGLTAVRDFNLTVQSRELVALIGPNGAGKTTLFNMLTGVYSPTSGTIHVCGRNTRGLLPYQIAALGAARTFQNIRLFKDLTVFDNVRIACHHQTRTTLMAAIRKGNLQETEERWVASRADDLLGLMGLSERRLELARNLPYGEQRRLEIARALATGPKVLLLDEPAAGMNSSEKVDLMERIREIRDRFDVAIVLIEHDMKLVMGVSERIIVLDHGEMIAQGTPREIQANPKVIEAYLGAEVVEPTAAAQG